MQPSSKIIFRLTCLWAFVEAGLGGVLHLLHIPITGFVVGGLAIMIVILLAKYSEINPKTMLASLGLVLLIKFSLSPQSPPGAYIATAFQGIMGVIIFSIFRLNFLSILSFSILTMIESAIQKPLLAYMILGKDFWNQLLLSAQNFIHLDWIYFGFGVYILLYILWGIFIAKLTHELLRNIENYTIPKSFRFIKEDEISIKKSKKLFCIFIVGIALVLFYFQFIIQACLLIVWIFILPIVLNYILTYFQSKYTESIRDILIELPIVKQNFISAFHYARESNQWREGLRLCIYLNVFNQHLLSESPGLSESGIYILTGNIQSGKSTALLEFYHKNMSNCDGFLTPDIDGCRKLILLSLGETYDFELGELDEDIVEIGKFKFRKKIFHIAKSFLKTFHSSTKKFIIIDEIGTLEMDGQGFEPELSSFISKFKLNNYDQKLILVVRDSLQDMVVKTYELESAKILTISEFKVQFNS